MFIGPLVIGVSIILNVICLSKNPIFTFSKNKKFKNNLHELNIGCLATAFGITLASISVFNSGAINVLFSLGMIVLFSIFGSKIFYFFKNKVDKDVAYFMFSFAALLLIYFICLRKKC